MGAAMKTARDILSEKKVDIVCVPTGTTIKATLNEMNTRKVGAILITRDEKVVGIWTERDLMRNIMDTSFDLETANIEDYMTTDLIYAPYDATVFDLMDKFLGLRIRHLLIEQDGEYIGIISGGDVMKAAIQEKDDELKQLNAMVGWEYYENWRWKPK
jgi:signal-transduction protein with cAMP-binding, CBS, and nucleotidyltransferase domain